MKSLLAMTAMGALAANIVTPVINQSEVTQKTFAGKEFRFNENNEEFEFYNSYSYYDIKDYKFMFQYDITDINIEDYQYFSALDPDNKSYTKTSWDNSPYCGVAFKTLQNVLLSSFIKFGKVANEESHIWKSSDIVLFHSFISVGLTTIETCHKFGLSYYIEDEKTFLQFFGIQFIASDVTFNGGAMWTNYGIGFKLT